MNNTSNNINNLDKTDDNKPITVDHKVEYVEHFNKFFDTFKFHVVEYDYHKSMDAIGDYYNDYIEYGIIPYIDITNYIYDMSVKDEQKNEHLSVNLEKCFKNIYNELMDKKKSHPNNYEEQDEYKIKHTQYQMVFRIYTHVGLARVQSKTFYQLSDSVKGEIDKRILYEINPKIDELANKNESVIKSHIDEFQQDMKKSERDYITILGIFITIIFAFTGSIILPANLVSNAVNIEPAKLVLLILGIAFTFINMLYLLTRFIMMLDDRKTYLSKKLYILWINLILIILFISSACYAFYVSNNTDRQSVLSDNNTKCVVIKVKD